MVFEISYQGYIDQKGAGERMQAKAQRQDDPGNPFLTE